MPDHLRHTAPIAADARGVGDAQRAHGGDIATVDVGMQLGQKCVALAWRLGQRPEDALVKSFFVGRHPSSSSSGAGVAASSVGAASAGGAGGGTSGASETW